MEQERRRAGSGSGGIRKRQQWHQVQHGPRSNLFSSRRTMRAACTSRCARPATTDGISQSSTVRRWRRPSQPSPRRAPMQRSISARRQESSPPNSPGLRARAHEKGRSTPVGPPSTRLPWGQWRRRGNSLQKASFRRLNRSRDTPSGFQRWARMDGKVHDEPSSVASQDGEVIVDGPDGVAVSLTPEAAEETGDRLIGKAVDAAAYRRRKEAGRSAPGERHRPNGPH